MLKSCLHGCAVCLCAAASHGRRGDARAGCRRNHNNRAGTFDWGWIETFHVLAFSTQTWHATVFGWCTQRTPLFIIRQHLGKMLRVPKWKKKNHSHVYGSSTCTFWFISWTRQNRLQAQRTLALLNQPPCTPFSMVLQEAATDTRSFSQQKWSKQNYPICQTCIKILHSLSTHIQAWVSQEVKVLHAKLTLSIISNNNLSVVLSPVMI